MLEIRPLGAGNISMQLYNTARKSSANAAFQTPPTRMRSVPNIYSAPDCAGRYAHFGLERFSRSRTKRQIAREDRYRAMEKHGVPRSFGIRRSTPATGTYHRRRTIVHLRASWRHGAPLTCMESDTGTELWRFEYPTDYEDMYGYNNGPRSCPVVDGGTCLYLRCSGKVPLSECFGWDPVYGRWIRQARFNVVQNFFGTASTPIVKVIYSLLKLGVLHRAPRKICGHQTANHHQTARVSSLSTKRQAKWFTKSVTN